MNGKPWLQKGRGRRRTPGTMNGTEQKYAEHLEHLVWMKEILWYRFEGMTFRLANMTRYTPDFSVMLPSGLIELHEVKGHWEDDARVKIKVAAEQFPFAFVGVKPIAKKHGGGWKREEF